MGTNHRRLVRSLVLLAAAFAVVLTVEAPSVDAQTTKPLTEWPLPEAASRPLSLRVAPDGTVPFLELVGRIGLLDTSGHTITEWSVNPASSLLGISVAPPPWTGNGHYHLAFSEYYANKVALPWLFTSGPSRNALIEVTLPEPSSFPTETSWGICADVFVAEAGGNRIALMSGFVLPPSTVVYEFAIPTSNSGPDAIVVVPNGTTCNGSTTYDVWFAELSASKIGRLHYGYGFANEVNGLAVGTFTEWAVPGNAAPSGLRVLNGEVFFANQSTNTLARLNPVTNMLTQWTNPDTGALAFDVQNLTSGLLAFTDAFKVGTLDTSTPGFDTAVTPTTTVVTPTINFGASVTLSILTPVRKSVSPTSTEVTGTVTDGFTLWNIPTSPFAGTAWIAQLPSGAIIFTEEYANKIATLQ